MKHAMLWAAQTCRNLAQRLTNWARKVFDAIRARAAARGAFTPATEVATEGEVADVVRLEEPGIKADNHAGSTLT